MIGQKKIVEKEQRIPKFLWTENGCEILSDDQSVKIILSLTHNFNGQMETEFYTANYYVENERKEFEKIEASWTIPSIDEYMSKLEHNEDYREAYKDYEESQKNKFNI